jgi:hypothetical protein
MSNRFTAVLAIVGLSVCAISPNASAEVVTNTLTPPFVVTLTTFAALPPATPSITGEERVVADGHLVASMPLGWEDTATTARPVVIKVGGIDWPVRPGQRMRRVAEMDGGDLATLPAGAVVYCGGTFASKQALETARKTLGISTLVSRFDLILQVCAVDADADGRFDKGFLVGARTNEYRKLAPLDEPIAYEVAKGVPISHGWMQLVYNAQTAISPAFVRLQLAVEGQVSSYGTYTFPDNGPPVGVKETGAERRAREAAAPKRIDTNIGLPERNLPLTFTVGNARFTARSVDKQAKTAVFVTEKDQTFFPVRFLATPSRIYY